MATIRRNPMSAGTNSLNEKYMNFLEYKGLNTNKNYVSIDQETFTEVNNMYVNQENQLSTRPPEEIFVMTEGWQAIKVWKINDKTFYHLKYVGTSDANKGLTQNAYYLACPASWSTEGFQLYETTETIYLCWLNFAYCLFETDKITAIVYGENKIDFYVNDGAVYFPITKLYNGAEVYTSERPDPTGQVLLQLPNILTSGYRERYLFESTISNSNAGNLEGKTVTVKIGEDTHTINWVKDNDKVFYKRIGAALDTDSNDNYQVAHVNGNYFVYLYSPMSTESSSEGTQLISYISIDATVWYKVKIPFYNTDKTDGWMSFVPLQIPVLSTQGGYLYYLEYTNLLTNTNINIYRKAIDSANIANINSSEWTKFQSCKCNNSAGRVYINNYNAKIGEFAATYYLLGTSDEIYVPSIDDTSVAVLEAYDGRSYTIPRASGYADDYTFAFEMTFSGRFTNAITSGKLSKSIAGYYCGCLLAVGDSSKANTRLWTLTTQDSVPSAFDNSMESRIRFLKIAGQSILLIHVGPSKLQSQIDDGSDIDYVYCTTVSNDFVIDGYYLQQPYRPNIVYTDQNNRIGAAKYPTCGFIPATVQNVNLKNSADKSYYFDGLVFENGYEYIDSKFNLTKIKISNIVRKDTHPKSYYEYYIKNITDDMTWKRIENPYDMARDITTKKLSTPSTGQYFPNFVKLSKDNVLVFNYFNYGESHIPMLINGIPLYVDDNGLILWRASDGTIYSNQYTETISVDNLVKGSIDYIMPEHSVDFITTCLSQGNVFYQSSKALIDTDISEGKNLFYIPKNTKNDNIFTDKITALVNFSQTALGIFLETTAYQLTYDSSNNVYYLSKTKLALGNRDGSDMLLSYDGNNIYITTLKGLSTLNYQDFVQSTEQIYRYLTEAIMDVYQVYAKYPIKLCQYKEWLFLYHTNSAEVFVYDLRSSSWWKWTLPQYPKQLVYINDSKFTEDLVLVDEAGHLHKFRFDEVSVYDNELTPFDWSFTTQKMHFGAPNNYKHIRSVSIVTEQSGKPLRFKLKFTNYRNLNNLSDSDTVEYDIDQLTTMIKRVNFIKTNAFQLQVSNDKTDKYPQAFVTPNIAIKYRITERLR